MSRVKEIILPEDERLVQTSLIAPTGYKGGFDPFPTILPDSAGFERVIEDCHGELGLDFEFNPTTHRPSIIGIASRNYACAVPWSERLAAGLARDAEDGRFKLIGHAVLTADRIVMRDAGYPTSRGVWVDTMLEHYLLNAHLCSTPGKEETDDPGSLGFMGLQTMATLTTMLPVYKACRGVDCFGPCPTHKPFDYCAVDAWAGLEGHRVMAPKIGRMGIPQQFQDELAELTDLCVEMQERGVRTDREYVKWLAKSFDEEKERLFPGFDKAAIKVKKAKKSSLQTSFFDGLEEAVQVRGEFNPRSPAQAVSWFNENEIPLRSGQAKEVTKTLEKCLKKLGYTNVRAYENSGDILTGPVEALYRYHQFKNEGKGLASWFDKKYLDKNGFAHPRFIVTGTATGRISSAKPNFTNIPKRGFGEKVRKAILPLGDMHDLLSADFKQLELRMVLYLSGVDPSIVGTDAFIWLVGQSDGQFKKAAEIMKTSERDAAKRVSHACLTGDHEVLTESGWKRIDLLEKPEKIAIWDTGKVSFEAPKALHCYSYEGKVFEIRGTSLNAVTTPEHKWPVLSSGTWNGKTYDKWYRKSSEEISAMKSGRRIPVNGVLDNTDYPLTDNEIRLAVAIQADGSFVGNKVRFHFHKERKIERLKLLAEEKLESNKVCACNKGRQLRIILPSPLLDKNKSFTPEVLKLSQRQRLIFLEEILFWDGNISNDLSHKSYTNSDLVSLNLIQAVASISGKQGLFRKVQKGSFPGSKKELFKLSFNNRNYADISSLQFSESQFDGNVYCVTTSSGYFLIRYRGGVSVTGNSSYLEGITVITDAELRSPRINREIAAGALRVYYDWEYAGGVVAFTGANLAEALFGDKSWENRRKALSITEDIYFARFPMIRQWHRKTLAEIEARGYIQSPTGRFLRLSGSLYDGESRKDAMVEDAKIAAAFLGQGVSADHFQAVALKYRREKVIEGSPAIPVLLVHDDIVFSVPCVWSKEKRVDFMRMMEEETWRLQGFKAPVEIKTGRNWKEMEVIE